MFINISMCKVKFNLFYKMIKINLKTSVGKVECFYEHSSVANAPVAIVVNSNEIDAETNKPRYEEAGKVIIESFIENGFSTLSFMAIDEKDGKKDLDEDSINLLHLTSIADWLHTKNIESHNFWVCGIDNGAIAALELVMRRPEIENYILVSPNIKKNDLSFVVPCAASGMLVRASEDLRFLEDDCISLQDKLTTKTESKIKYMTIYDAERNFDTELEQLKKEIKSYVLEKMSSDYKNFKTISINKRRRRKKRHLDGDEEKIIYVNPIKPLDIDNI